MEGQSSCSFLFRCSCQLGPPLCSQSALTLLYLAHVGQTAHVTLFALHSEAFNKCDSALLDLNIPLFSRVFPLSLCLLVLLLLLLFLLGLHFLHLLLSCLKSALRLRLRTLDLQDFFLGLTLLPLALALATATTFLFGIGFRAGLSEQNFFDLVKLPAKQVVLLLCEEDFVGVAIVVEAIELIRRFTA